MIDLARVGAHVHDDTVRFGLYLPSLQEDAGVQLIAKISHIRDLSWSNVVDCPLHYTDTQEGYPYYEGVLDLSGKPRGVYRYQYQLRRGTTVFPRWASDPFARQTAAGHRSAFLYGDEAEVEIPPYEIPPVRDLVIYECNVSEFNRTFRGVLQKLTYLEALGITAIEFMPISNIVETYRWGYVPLNLYAPDERFGTLADLKHLVKACHESGIAVLLDVVYNHISGNFGYNVIYDQLGLDNPVTGTFEKTFPGLRDIDYRKPFARDFIFAVNRYFLTTFGIDGFRYDFTPGYFDGVHIGNVGLSHLLWATHEFAVTLGRPQIIQCIEHLEDTPAAVFNTTYANACWYEDLRSTVETRYATGHVDDEFIRLLDLDARGYLVDMDIDGTKLQQSPVIYLETHDHSRLISYFPGRAALPDYYGKPQGDRYANWYRTLPYVIALFTGQGTPMIHQGQEFGENYRLPSEGPDRVLNFRFLRWENSEDSPGRELLRVYQQVIALRKQYAALRSRGPNSFWYYDRYDPLTGGRGAFQPPRGVYFFKRQDADEVIFVALNATPHEVRVPHPFPALGTWRDLLHGSTVTTTPHQLCPVRGIPSHYGRIYLLESADDDG